MNAMFTSGQLEGFLRWVSTAPQGAERIYFTGYLASATGEARHVAAAARDAADAGKVHLVQRRLGPPESGLGFDFVAIRRPRR